MLEMHQQATAATADVKADSSSTASFWRSFHAALPPLGTVGGVYGIPPDYLPLIQEPAVVSFTSGMIDYKRRSFAAAAAYQPVLSL
jgi:hypothetical protein